MPVEVRKLPFVIETPGKEMEPMRATLEFELPEDHENYRQAADGMNWANAMWGLEQFIRTETKYKSEEYSEDELNVYRVMRDKINDLMNEYNLRYPS